MANKKYFRLPVDPPKETITPAGSKIEDVWAMKLDEHGNETFYVSGQTNVYEKIQVEAPATRIENILERCMMNDDYSILQQVKGTYADLTAMPKNIFEASQKIREAEKTFEKLPLEVRRKYDFNFNKYLKDFGTEEWINNMGLNKKDTEQPKEEVKKEEE